MLNLTQRRQLYRTQMILLHQDFALLKKSLLEEVALVAEGFARYVVKQSEGSSNGNSNAEGGFGGGFGGGNGDGTTSPGCGRNELHDAVILAQLCGWSWKCFEVWIDALERLLEPLDEQIGPFIAWSMVVGRWLMWLMVLGH